MGIRWLSLLIALGCALAGSGVHAAPAPAAAAGPSASSDSLNRDLEWRMIGPMRGGRTRALAGVPTQPHVFYIGAVNGGVWKTDDAGRTWRPIFDGQPTQSIGAIAVAPSSPETIYVGSGEGLLRPDLSVGNGMYRSPDGGRTWSHLGLDDAQQIPQLAVDPHDARRVFAAVLGHPYGPSETRGIYRSVDGGASWQRVLYKDADTGGSAVLIDPSHPEIVYAGLWQARLGPWEDKNEFNGTGGGLFKSTDGGTTWRRLGNGLPVNLSQINLALAPSRPERLYATIATTESGDYSSAAGLGLFRSDDGGESWTRITTDPRPALRIGGGDLAVVTVDATNPDVLYVASIVTMKSTDGGKTWMSLRGAPGGDDYQNVWVNPNDPRIVAVGSDQGVVISLNGGQTWSSWFNQPTAQLYHVAIAPAFPYRVCAGQQESGSLCISSRGNDGSITNRDWHPVGVIEYGYVAPDPLDPDVIYGAGRNEVSKYHWSTGQVQNVTPNPVRTEQIRVDRTEPLLFSPHDPHTLYYGADRLYRTTDGGASWQAISPDLAREAGAVPASVGALHPKGAERQRGVIYALGPSTLAAGTLWAGTDDGFVWLTRDGGVNWTNVTPPALTPWSKVTQVDASHFDAATAYVSVSRLRIDDLKPYVYRTRDYGATWQSITAGLAADGPVNAVREDPQRRGLLFAAAEKGVWVSFDDGGHWESLQLNLPATSMRDVWVHGNDLILATHGRSIWILDDISRLRQLGGTAPQNVVLLKPTQAWRVQRSTWTDTPIPPDEPLGSNPPDGAVIEFFLPRDARRQVVLEILDGRGDTVRRFSSADAPTPGPDELGRELIPSYWLAQPRVLPATRGMHRWVWDLRYAAPLSVTHGYPIAAVPHATPRTPEGPVALPGAYRVRLTVDGKHYEADLTVQEDPRVSVTPQALEAQLRLAKQLAELLTESSQTLLAARSQEEQLKALGTADATAETLTPYRATLAQLLGSEEPAPQKPAAKPKGEEQEPSAKQSSEESSGGQKSSDEHLPDVQEHIASLYAEVLRPDAAPTAAQQSAMESLQGTYKALLGQWQQLQGQLPDLNQRLRAARLAPLRTDLPPWRDPNVAEEE